MVEPKSRATVLIYDFGGLSTNDGRFAVGQEDALMAASIVNLTVSRQSSTTTRPGFRTVTFDEDESS